MKKYEGKKYVYFGSRMIIDRDIWYEKVYKEEKIFIINKSYKKYMIEKKKEEIESNISLLKYKIEKNLDDKNLLIGELLLWVEKLNKLNEEMKK